MVVSGVYVRDVEFKNPNDCDGGGVTEGAGEDVEGGTEMVELLAREVVVGEVVEGIWDEDSDVEEGVVGLDPSVLVLGDWLGGEAEGSLSAQISGQILSDGVSGTYEVEGVSDGGMVDMSPSLLGELNKGVRSETCLGYKARFV
jgi:hypothetical protein